MTTQIRKENKGNDEITITAYEIPQAQEVIKTEYFVEYWEDGIHEVATRVANTAEVANEILEEWLND